MNIPAQHQAIMPYLILKDANRFLNFVKNVFDAQIISVFNRENEETIMHAEVKIAGQTIMFAEATDEWGAQNAGLFIYVKDADETFNKALTNGGEIIMPLVDKDYGRSGGIKDSTGNTWWITSL